MSNPGRRDSGAPGIAAAGIGAAGTSTVAPIDGSVIVVEPTVGGSAS